MPFCPGLVPRAPQSVLWVPPCTHRGHGSPAPQILSDYVQLEVSHSPSDVASMQLSRFRVTDGEWHHLLIELRSAKEGKDIKYLVALTLDYGMDQVRGTRALCGTDPFLRLPEGAGGLGGALWAPGLVPTSTSRGGHRPRCILAGHSCLGTRRSSACSQLL